MVYLIPNPSKATTALQEKRGGAGVQQSFQKYKPCLQSQEQFSLNFCGTPAKKGWLTKFAEGIRRCWDSLLKFLKLRSNEDKSPTKDSQSQVVESSKHKATKTTSVTKPTQAHLESELKAQEREQENNFKTLRLAKWNFSQVLLLPQYGVPLDRDALKKEAAKVSEAAHVFFQNIEKQEQAIKNLESEYQLDLSTKKQVLAEAKNQFSKYNQPPNDLELEALKEMEALNKKSSEIEKEMMPEIEALKEKQRKGELTEEEEMLQYEKIMQKIAQSFASSTQE